MTRARPRNDIARTAKRIYDRTCDGRQCRRPFCQRQLEVLEAVGLSKQQSDRNAGNGSKTIKLAVLSDYSGLTEGY